MCLFLLLGQTQATKHISTPLFPFSGALFDPQGTSYAPRHSTIIGYIVPYVTFAPFELSSVGQHEIPHPPVVAALIYITCDHVGSSTVFWEGPKHAAFR